MNDDVAELRRRLADPAHLVQQLGLAEGQKRQARGVIIRCPAHVERTPSCSVRIANDGTIAARCHGCGWSADALGLIATARGLSLSMEFRRVLEEAANLCGYQLERPGAPRAPRPAPVRLPPPPPPRRPPAGELAALWEAARPPNELEDDDAEAALFFLGRGLQPYQLGKLDLVRVSSRSWRTSARWWPGSWRRAWRLFIRAYDASGALQSVQARAVVDVGDGPKTRWPFDCSADGLFFADTAGRALLRSERVPSGVLFVEGITDTLWAAHAMRGSGTAVLGVTSGSMPAIAGIKLPSGVPVTIATDHDKAGEKYAAEIVAALPSRNRVTRWMPPRGNR